MSQTRRLAAILAADVAGYSRLMGRGRRPRCSLIGHSPQPIFVPKPVDPGEVALVIGERGSAAGSLIRKSPQFDDRL
jgi:hypothetical protein